MTQSHATPAPRVSAYTLDAPPGREADSVRIEQTGGLVQLADGRLRFDPSLDRWAIRLGPWCLRDDDQWVYEPTPSSRDDDFVERHRFPLDDAIQRARAAYARRTAEIAKRNANGAGR